MSESCSIQSYTPHQLDLNRHHDESNLRLNGPLYETGPRTCQPRKYNIQKKSIVTFLTTMQRQTQVSLLTHMTFDNAECERRRALGLHGITWTSSDNKLDA